MEKYELYKLCYERAIEDATIDFFIKNPEKKFAYKSEFLTFKEISKSKLKEKLPKEVYKLVNKYDAESENEDEKITEIASFVDNDYGIYEITYPYAYVGQSNKETIFMNKNRIIGISIVVLIMGGTINSCQPIHRLQPQKILRLLCPQHGA